MRSRFFACLLATGLMVSAANGATFLGNGNAGFGGTLGNGSLELNQVGTTSEIDGTFTIGGAFNDAAVFYLDTTAGGFTDTSTFTDTADGGRSAISGFDGTNRSTVNFAPGFDADFAITAESTFFGLFALDDASNFTFVTSLDAMETAPGVFDFGFDLADVGLVAGDSVDFVGTYLNNSNAFRSDEAIGDGIAAGNPGQTPVTFTNAVTFSTVTAVPEPSSLAALTVCIGAVAARRRRRR